MIRMKKISYCVCMVLVLFIFQGCVDQEEKVKISQEIGATDIKPVYGGELRVPLIMLATLNPILNDNKSIGYFNNFIYDSLIKIDENYKVQSSLAKDWSYSDDGKTLIFELRENIRWHDGSTFSAEDVKFTIDTLKTGMKMNKISVYSPLVENINNVVVFNSNKISIEFKDLGDYNIEKFVFPIIPKHQFKNSVSVYNDMEMMPIGTGPYKVDIYDKFKGVRLIANDEYWKEKPYISSIIGKRVPDKETALTFLESNDIDVVGASSFDWEKYSENKSLKIHEYRTQACEFLVFNFNKPIVQDENIRKAIAYGIDRNEIINKVYLGHGTIVDFPFDFSKTLKEQQKIKYKKDVEKAKKILKVSNWYNRDDDLWLENEAGEELTLSLLVNDDPYRLDVVDVIAKQLETIGIRVNIEKEDWLRYKKRITNSNFDIALTSWYLGSNEDMNVMFRSGRRDYGNFGGYKNPKVDQLLDEIIQTNELVLKKKKYKEFEKEIEKDIPYFNLGFRNNSIIMRNDINGEIIPRFFNIYNDIDKWYIIRSEE